MTNKRIEFVIRKLATMLNTAATWDYDDLQDSEDKTFILRYLPYIDGIESGVIGYEPQSFRRGRGYGRWEEFFTDLDDARARMTFLINAGAIEDAEIRKRAPGQGKSYPTLMDEWKDPTEPTED